MNFCEIQHFTGPGIFGTGYTSTHTQVIIQKTNYTLRRLASFSCQVRRSTRSFVQLLFWARNLSANRLCHIGLSFIWYNYSTYHHALLSFHQIFVSSTMGLSTLLLLVIFTANEDIIGLLEVAFEQCKVIAVTSLQFNHFLTASTGFSYI